MQSKKEYEAKIRQLTATLKKTAAQYETCKLKVSKLRSTLKQSTQRKKELQFSRDKWKAKFKASKLTVKGLSRQLTRRGKVNRHFYPLVLMQLCVLLRVEGNCSYASIVTTLKLLKRLQLLVYPRLPCGNTVQNWVAKVGLQELKNTANQLAEKEVVLIMDESIRIGREKQLLILSTPYKKTRTAALCFQDVNVLYFGGRNSWTGQRIADLLQQLNTKISFKVRAIISDEDATLKKACRLREVAHLPDISHAIGTCLRKTFKPNAAYQGFAKLLSAFKEKGVNQSVTYLLPPRQGTKVRFMNLAGPVKWAVKMLARMDQLSVKEHAFFAALPAHAPIIKCLEACLLYGTYFSETLKKEGLSSKRLKQLLTTLDRLLREKTQQGEVLVVGFLHLLRTYFVTYQSFITKNEGENVPVSSEIIESLFGKYKHIASKNKLTITTKLNLQIPVLCMGEEAIIKQTKEALEAVLLTDIDTWVALHATDNQVIKRKKFFQNGKSFFNS